MSTQNPGGQQASAQPPSEEELRAAYEEQLSRVSSVEMAMQASVSLLAVGGRRLGLAPGSEGQRDLEQVRDAIDAVRGLMPVLERRLARELGPLRDALSQLQMAYAQEAQRAAARSPGASGGEQAGAPETGVSGEPPPASSGREPDAAGQPPAGAGQPPAGDEQGRNRPGPAEASGRLWVPGR